MLSNFEGLEFIRHYVFNFISKNTEHSSDYIDNEIILVCVSKQRFFFRLIQGQLRSPVSFRKQAAYKV